MNHGAARGVATELASPDRPGITALAETGAIDERCINEVYDHIRVLAHTTPSMDHWRVVELRKYLEFSRFRGPVPDWEQYPITGLTARMYDPRIPGAAFRSCSCGGTMYPLADALPHCDEGDGSAQIDIYCSRIGCKIESSHSWTLSPEDYRTEFGHDFDENPEEDAKAELADQQETGISHGQAHRVAAEWSSPWRHGLTALATSGMIRPDCADDIRAELRDALGQADPEVHAELQELLTYVTAHGTRERMPDWVHTWDDTKVLELDHRIPADAVSPCPVCETGTMRPERTHNVTCDEGDGSASINTVCDNPACGVLSGHSWTLSDGDYRAEFGHDFGEDPEEEAEADLADELLARHAPREEWYRNALYDEAFYRAVSRRRPQPPEVGTEVTGLPSAIDYAARMSAFAAQTTERVGDLLPTTDSTVASCEQARGRLAEAGVSGQALADVSLVQEQLTATIADLHGTLAQLDAAAQAANSLNDQLSRQHAVRDAYAANPDAGDRGFLLSE